LELRHTVKAEVRPMIRNCDRLRRLAKIPEPSKAQSMLEGIASRYEDEHSHLL